MLPASVIRTAVSLITHYFSEQVNDSFQNILSAFSCRHFVSEASEKKCDKSFHKNIFNLTKQIW